MSKYGHLMHLMKVTPDIDFTEELVVQCNSPVVTIL